jgi:hypothetical protein
MIKHISQSAIALLVITAPALSANARYPDLSLTPGKARSDVTVEQLCTTNWSANDHPVSAAMRRDVFAEYHLTGNSDPVCHNQGSKKCKIDRLIASKLGGADVEVNLWPQPEAGTWGAPAKTKLVDCMHARVCKKLADQGADAATQLLHLYQHDLVADWIAAFHNVIGEPTATCGG